MRQFEIASICLLKLQRFHHKYGSIEALNAEGGMGVVYHTGLDQSGVTVFRRAVETLKQSGSDDLAANTKKGIEGIISF